MMAFSGWTRTLVLAAPVAALLLAGCSRERAQAGRYCRQYKKCDENAFFDEFDSVRECRKLNKLQNRVSSYQQQIEYGSLCEKAYDKYQSCLSKEIDCDFFEDFDSWAARATEECTKEAEEREAECVNDD